jgi:hypothetical protein
VNARAWLELNMKPSGGAASGRCSKPANSTNRNLQCAINVLITRGLRGA